jgi:hypothetical protein
LGDPLRTDVVLQQPTSLDDAIIFTRAYELRNRSLYKLTPSSASVTSSPAPAALATASVNKPAWIAIRLTPTEIAQRRKDGKCFRCDELFTNGHKEVCKQLFSIEVVDEDTDDSSHTATELTISIHALTGIQPHILRTMKIVIDINDARLLALVDIGSTHNFVDVEAAVRTGILLAEQTSLQVAVANGDRQNYLRTPI